MKKLLQENKWFLLGLMVLGFVAVINHFPAGHIILGGDVLQAVNLKEQYANFHYGWFAGRVSLFYGIFYFLDVLGVSSTAQLSWYLGIFLFGAYLSFWLFCQLVFPRTPKLIAAGMSLFYATNIYTLYIFTSTWGFFNYQTLYIFIPALTGLYIKVLETRKSFYIFLFFLFISVASTSFGNPAFALSLAIYFILLSFALFVFRLIPFDLNAVRKIIFLACGALLLNVYWILPLIPQVRLGVEEVNVSSDIVLSEALTETSNAIFDTMRLLPTAEQKIYYPYNFPYVSISQIKHTIAFLAFAPFFIVLFGLFCKRSEKQKILYFIFFSLFIIFIILVARVRFPFDSFNNFLFQLPGFNVLRGWDKMAIFTPFILSAMLLVVFSEWENKKYLKIVLICFGFIALTLALPFYLGGIQTKLSYILAGNKKKNFNTANYSALVKIPEPYYVAADIFQKDKSENKISMLPFSPGSSVGRVNLPKLKINGPHFANALYTKRYVELNDYYLGKWFFAKEFDRGEYNPRWITDLYGLIGIEYVFYHHDAKQKSLEKFEMAKKFLEDQRILQPLAANEWFTLYRIDKQYVFPYVYANAGSMKIDQKIDGLSEKINSFRSYTIPLSYQRKNPKEIIVSAKANTNMSNTIVYLNEKYDPLWRAEYVFPEGKRISLERNDDVKYANAWKVGKFEPNGKIGIYYMPVRLLRIGEWISGIALFFVIFGTVLVLRRKNNL